MARVSSINIYKLKMIKEDTVEYSTTIKSPADIAALARDVLEMHEMAEENFVIVCLNTKNKIAGVHTVSIGSLSSSIVHPREVFKAALLNNAGRTITPAEILSRAGKISKRHTGLSMQVTYWGSRSWTISS